MTIRNFLILGVFLVSLSGCESTDLVTPQPPTPRTYHITLSPALPHAEKAVRHCLELENISGAIISHSPEMYPELTGFDAALWWGPPHQYEALSSGDYRLYYLGEMDLIPVTSPENTAQEISPTSLAAIFQGQVQVWPDVFPDLENQIIQPVTYPPLHPLREVFSTAVLSHGDYSPNALIVPSPEALIELIQDDTTAVGYLPAPLLSQTVHELPLETSIAGLRHPVLGITPREDAIRFSGVLACVSEQLKR